MGSIDPWNDVLHNFHICESSKKVDHCDPVIGVESIYKLECYVEVVPVSQEKKWPPEPTFVEIVVWFIFDDRGGCNMGEIPQLRSLRP